MGKNAVETTEIIKVDLDSRQWDEHEFLSGFPKFRSGVVLVESAEHWEHPLKSKTDENVNHVKHCVLKNRRTTICEVACILGMLCVSVQSALRDNLNMHPVASKFMPCLLSEEQKENCVTMCLDFEEMPERDAKLVLKSVTHVETWVLWV